jgi:3-methylcrotonyl-CoA carboxylase beta subunit
LGGADVHTRISGVADHLAEDDEEALAIVRRIIGHLGGPPAARRELSPPRLDPEDIAGIVPADPRMAYDVREIIARVVDGSEFDEFKARYGETLVCGFARIYGHPVGIIANNGILFSESALKGTHFIQLCCRREVPLVFLQNVAGFMVGKRYEAGGIAKDGAKMVTAVACAEVPKITVIIGGSFGAGNYAMAGRAYEPRFLFTWPNARIAVMGGDTAARVLAQVRREAARDWPAADEEAFKRSVRDRYETQGGAFYATARLWDDGVIEPAATWAVLGASLDAAMNGPVRPTQFGIFRM